MYRIPLLFGRSIWLPRSSQVAERLANILGSMRFFYGMLAIQTIWMFGMTVTRGPDQYPFAFLLFLGNQIQLYALPILQHTQNRQSGLLLQLVEHIDREEAQELGALAVLTARGSGVAGA